MLRNTIKEHGSLIAIGLALLALVVAGSGAAVAVGATVVNIADPTAPSRVAHVDSSGRLQVVTQLPTPSTISVSNAFLNNGVTMVTAPTTATLVITGFGVDETRLNGTVDGADLSLALVQFGVNSTGQCDQTKEGRYLYGTTLGSGESRTMPGEPRLQVRSVGGAKYCLGIISRLMTGTVDATNYYPTYAFTAYAASGAYTGASTGASSKPGPIAK